MNLPIYSRNIRPLISESMLDTPVLLLAGPRQSGKTTLVKEIANQYSLKYLTMDDDLTLLSAKTDPVTMINSLDKAVIDEIQRAPQLLLAIKKSVDEDRRPGRFLITGSSNLMMLPTVADSLAGRMETLSLFPLSQSELESNSVNWIDHIFSDQIPNTSEPVSADELIERVLRGGYPEAISRPTSRRRIAWSRQYIDALINRDVRDIANIEKLTVLPRFLRALAQTAGQMCNYTQLGGQVGLDSKTSSKYVGVFEQMYLLKRIEVWTRNHLNRIVKTPKLQFIDSGLLSTLLGLTTEEIQEDRKRFGHILETFVFGELTKHKSCAENEYQIMYYRDADKFEVDFVIENSAGKVVGIEVKAAATVKESDLNGLNKLAKLSGDQFKMGILLYNGGESMPLGNNNWAVPISSLWGTVAPPAGIEPTIFP